MAIFRMAKGYLSGLGRLYSLAVHECDQALEVLINFKASS